ncbi:hypothetical protein [Streptomyces sp. H39-C1]|uniref:hypothetical protein n=1 Tax=Streptomyces sp. H39-C1 TaxID=3004355 RepID=UPI0022AEC034|nr:hypothetical protein [Streptomyces sp. H39-C1]MCZ4098056.1 hypothetical protein [Streptomyces sp. H39-C1]
MLAVYQGLSQAEGHSYAQAKVDPSLGKYAAHTALTDIEATVFYYQQKGTVMKGAVTRAPNVTGISLQSVPLKATIVDCVDSNHYYETNAKTGVPVKSTYTGSRRHIVMSTAERSKTGTWKIYTSVIDRDRTC